jgi:hypothetical protein
MIFNSKAPWWLRSLSGLMLAVGGLTFFIPGLFWAFLGSVSAFLFAVAYAKSTKKV